MQLDLENLCFVLRIVDFILSLRRNQKLESKSKFSRRKQNLQTNTTKQHDFDFGFEFWLWVLVCPSQNGNISHLCYALSGLNCSENNSIIFPHSLVTLCIAAHVTPSMVSFIHLPEDFFRKDKPKAKAKTQSQSRNRVVWSCLFAGFVFVLTILILIPISIFGAN